MQNLNDNNNTIFLLPGQLIISKGGEYIQTILGSCVSIIFYNKRTQLSAICHAQHPVKFGKNMYCRESCPEPCGKNEQENSFRYVTCCFKHMLSVFQKNGIHKSTIEVSLYGGASVLNYENNYMKIGEKNIEIAKALIKKNNMTVVNENVGGKESRKLTFFSETGDVELANKSGQVMKG